MTCMWNFTIVAFKMCLSVEFVSKYYYYTLINGGTSITSLLNRLYITGIEWNDKILQQDTRVFPLFPKSKKLKLAHHNLSTIQRLVPLCIKRYTIHLYISSNGSQPR